MVVLHTLGSVEIRTLTRMVLPSATRAFATLLFLAENHGQEILRSELQSLIFPEENGSGSAHKFRQLVYRLRQWGVQVEGNADTILLPSDQVDIDHENIRSGERLTLDAAAAVSRGVLPGYEPGISGSFGRWVEDRRTAIRTDLLQYFVARLARLRARGRLNDLEPIARAVRALDPLNEEAALALAEVLALHGDKARAVKLLDHYLADVGKFGSDVTMQARVLRGRISERTSERTYRRLAKGPFVGRDREMAVLWGYYQRSRRGQGHAVVLHGEPGVGKTRLATEMLRAAALDGATCLQVECAAHDKGRPLGVFVNLVPQLLDAPGGLGVAPSALVHLQRLTRAPEDASTAAPDVHPQKLFDDILEAIRDLVAAVSEESPVVVLVDDAHSMDDRSFDTIVDFAGRHGNHRVLFLLTARDKLRPAVGVTKADKLYWQHVKPLGREASNELLRALAREHGDELDGDGGLPDTETLAEMAAGNPLYMRWLMAEGATHDQPGATPSLRELLLQRIQRLSELELRAFVAAVTLGRYCELDRLVQTAGLTAQELLAAVQALEQQGYLNTSGRDIRSSHPLLSEIAMVELPPLTLRLLRSTAAGLLEAAAAAEHNVTMMWDAAECWHLSGATDRAVKLLDWCATHCLGIGQPGTACEVLQRALAIGEPASRKGLLTHLLEAAQVGENYKLVLYAIREIRASESLPEDALIHDDIETIQIYATRLSGTPLPNLVPRLERCLTAQTASIAHRLSAAHSLIEVSELQLDRDAARQTFQTLSALPLRTRHERLLFSWAAVDYHLFSGDRVLGIKSCHQMLELLDAEKRESTRTVQMVAAGLALFRFGETHDGESTLVEALKEAQRLGMQLTTINVASMLAWMSLLLGNESSRVHYERLADSLYGTASHPQPRIGHYLSYKILRSLMNSDAISAADWLRHAYAEYSEIMLPSNVILLHAYELRIAQLQGSADDQLLSLEHLAKEHEEGCNAGMHDMYVEAYWHELTRRGARNMADQMLRNYVNSQRRDRHPLPPGLIQILATLQDSVDS